MEQNKKNKNTLIISDCPTDPCNAGNRSCIKQYCNLLTGLGYNIYFLYIYNDEVSKNELEMMREIWKEKLFLYKTPSFQFLFQKIINKIYKTANNPSLDLYAPFFIRKKISQIISHHNISSIIINYIWLSKCLVKLNVKTKIIFTHDVFSYKRLKGSQWLSFTPNQEAKALSRATHILAIQQNEAIYYSYLAPQKKIYTVYMPFTYTNQHITSNQNLLFFSGNNEHNIKGIQSFITQIYPGIKKTYPQIKLLIGGNICNHIKVEDESIILKGKYNNPKEFYQQGDIVINPVFEGTGLKVKTFEAISYGKIVLAHKHSMEGIFEKEYAPIIECNTSNDYIHSLRKIEEGIISISVQKEKCKSYMEKLNSYIQQVYNTVLNES